MQELTDKQQTLNQKLVKLTDYNKSFLTTASHLLDLGQRANQLFNQADNTGKQKILRRLLYNVEMFDQTLSYNTIYPYTAFIELNQKGLNDPDSSSWCPGLDSNQRP